VVFNGGKEKKREREMMMVANWFKEEDGLIFAF